MPDIIAARVWVPGFNDIDSLGIYAKLQRTSIEADRFGYLNQFSGWRVTGMDSVPEPAASSSAEVFSELCSKRAREIIKRSETEDLPIYVSYSGGVDSTCILCSFLREGIDKTRLRVLMTSESRDEYPLFYDKFLKDIQCIDTSKDIYADKYIAAEQDGLLVFGWCGDQLFGSDLNIWHPGWFYKPWKDFLEYYGDKEGFNPSAAIEQFEASFNHYGMPIENFAQFVWWLNFSCKWTYVWLHVPVLIEKLSDRYITFFSSEDFQRWSMARFDRVDSRPPQETPFYKPEMKSVILEVTGDTDYAQNKGKVGSWGVSATGTGLVHPAVLDTEGLHVWGPQFRIHPDRVSMYYERMINRYMPQYRRHHA